MLVLCSSLMKEAAVLGRVLNGRVGKHAQGYESEYYGARSEDGERILEFWILQVSHKAAPYFSRDI